MLCIFQKVPIRIFFYSLNIIQYILNSKYLFNFLKCVGNRKHISQYYNPLLNTFTRLDLFQFIDFGQFTYVIRQ